MKLNRCKIEPYTTLSDYGLTGRLKATAIGIHNTLLINKHKGFREDHKVKLTKSIDVNKLAYQTAALVECNLAQKRLKEKSMVV